MRRPDDTRFDFVLSRTEKTVLTVLAGDDGPGNFLKKLLNKHLRETGNEQDYFELRAEGRPNKTRSRPRHIPRRQWRLSA